MMPKDGIEQLSKFDAIYLAVLDLYESDGLIENGKEVGRYFGDRLNELAAHPLVGEVRTAGLLAGVELVVDKERKTRPPSTLQLA